jgi:hypothetical protein
MFNPDPSVAMKLQHFVSHAHDAAAAGDDPAAAAQEAATTFNLRLAAIFVVLLAGLLGTMPPLIGSWLRGSPNSITARLIRACSGGIILSLALVSTDSGSVCCSSWLATVCVGDLQRSTRLLCFNSSHTQHLTAFQPI